MGRLDASQTGLHYDEHSVDRLRRCPAQVFDPGFHVHNDDFFAVKDKLREQVLEEDVFRTGTPLSP